MDTLLETWGSYLSDQALLLLQNARNVADTQKIDVNILHVLFVAFTNKNLNIYKAIKEELKKKGFLKTDELTKEDTFKDLIQEIQREMESNALYLCLDMYRLACLEAVHDKQIQVSDILILEQILEKSYTVKQLLQTYRILPVLKSALQITGKRGKDTFKPPPASTLNANEVKDLLAQLHLVVTPPKDAEASSLAKIDNAMYHRTFDTLLQTLDTVVSEKNKKIVMLCGQNGSVFDLDKLESILAYRLALVQQTERSFLKFPRASRLSGYQLWHLSLHTLRNVSSDNPRFHPVVALRHLKQEATKTRAILLLSELETFSMKSSVDRRLKEQLANPDSACIVGCYRYYDQRPEEQQIRLGLSKDNVAIVFPERLDNRVVFYTLLEDYYRQRRPEQSLIFDRGAFESLFVLEAGTWIYKQRQTVPHLAIDLTDNCASTVAQGPQYVKNVAKDAINALDYLLQVECFETRKEVQEKFFQTLLQARERIRALLKNPVPETFHGKIVITQTLIEAQLFSQSNSEFHFPGLFPWSIPKQR